jgi:PTS system nitrogen regulatory IIA component
MAHPDPIADLLTNAHVHLGQRAGNKAALVALLARLAAAATGLPETNIATALAAREALGSTGFGKGVAVPHARIEGLSRVFGLLVRLDRPVPYDAVDGQPVDLVVLLLSPVAANAEHLSTLAAISRRLRDKSVASALRAAATQTEARTLLVGA